MKPWAQENRREIYRELDHPADVFLEVRARDLDELFERALYALYDHLVEASALRLERELELEGVESDLSLALRRLLSEALFRFDTEAFVATEADVEVDAGQPGDRVRARARLRGHAFTPGRDGRVLEVKAVTYHQLQVDQAQDGWVARFILDV